MGDIDIAVVDSLKVLTPDGRLEKRTSGGSEARMARSLMTDFVAEV